MPSHGPGLRDHIYFFSTLFFFHSFFFPPHRRYCTSIFIPPHVPARRPARWWTRGKMQPPNTIDRYEHTRNYHGRVLLRVQRFARPAGSQRAEGDRKSSALSKGRRSTCGRGYPLEQEARQRWTTGKRGKQRRGRETRRGSGKARGRQSEERALPSVQHARSHARARARERIAAPPSSPRGRRCSCRLRSVGAVLMPNVFVPMHQALLSRSRALASASWPAACPILLVPARRRATFDPTRSPRVSASLLSSASLDAPRCSTLAETRARADAHRAKVSGCTRAERRVTPRHRSVQRFPTSAPPPPIPLPTSNLPPPPPRSPPHRPRHGTAAPHGLRAFLMLNVAFCLCGCMGDSGREAVARPALFFKC